MLVRVKKTECPCSRAVSVKEVLQWASEWVEVIAPYAERPCAFFDIDHTLIDGAGDPLADVVALLRKCEVYNVHCFYVTARPETGRAETLRALERIKLHVPSERLAMMPVEINTTFDNIARMKRKARARFAHGLTPILNVGDAFSDGGSGSQLEMLKGVAIDDPKTTGVFMLQTYPFVKLPGRQV
jgi:hypothetical protein